MGTEDQSSPLAGSEPMAGTHDVIMETAVTQVPTPIPITSPLQLIQIIPQQNEEMMVQDLSLSPGSILSGHGDVPMMADSSSMAMDAPLLTDTSAVQFGIVDQSSPKGIQPSETSKEFTFRLQIASDEDVKIKSPTGLHLQEYDKWQLEKLMQDAIKRANYTDSSEVELPGISEEKQIQDFMIKHVTPDLQMKVDISVKDLRRIIPLLIMHLFNIREERTQKKVKGLWTERPRGWPDTVPYYDPNNQTKDGPGKPKKETLKKMFDFLLLKYREYVGGQWPAELLSPTPNGQAHTPIPSQLSPQLYPEASSSIVMAAGSMATGQVSPSLVVKMEEHHNDEEWMHELMERLRRKVAELEKDMYLNEKTVGLLCIIRDLLGKMYEVRGGDDEISLFFITSGHEFEATLDIVHLKQEMPKDHQRKWEEFQAKWYLKIVSLANQAMQGGSDISEAEALTRQ